MLQPESQTMVYVCSFSVAALQAQGCCRITDSPRKLVGRFFEESGPRKLVVGRALKELGFLQRKMNGELVPGVAWRLPVSKDEVEGVSRVQVPSHRIQGRLLRFFPRFLR